MKKIDLGQTISILANIGVIAGIVFLGYEIRQNTAAFQMQAADDYVASTIEMNNLISQDAELADLIYRHSRGDSDLTEVEAFRVRMQYANLFRNWNRLYFLRQRGSLDETFWNIQTADMRRNLQTPGVVEYWQSRREQFDPGLNRVIKDALSDISSE
jgi:hypothetical protein